MAGSIDYKELYYSGKLAKLAKECRRPADLARRLGVSSDALGCAMRRLRKNDRGVPTLPDFLEDAFSGKGQKVYSVSNKDANDDLPPRLKLTEEQMEEVLPGIKRRQQEELDAVDEHRLKRRLRELEARNKELLNMVTASQDQWDVVSEALSQRIDPIKPKEHKSGLREGVPVFLMSDLHLEERVDPAKVNFMNEFNLDIARRRMTRLAEGIRWFIEAQRQSFRINTACVWLGGDTFTSFLHPDNIESNYLAPPAAFAFAKQLIGDVIDFVLEDPKLERLVLPCNDGNHSRLSKDLRANTRAEMSLETLMYGMLANEYRDDKRVSFEIAQGDHLYTEIYNKTIRWTHGAEVRGGAGIGGVMIPFYRAMARWQTCRHADFTVAGHFHQRISLHDLEMNGSLIGYSPYALRIGARFEEPSQSAFMIDSRRGKSVSAPVWVADLDKK